MKNHDRSAGLYAVLTGVFLSVCGLLGGAAPVDAGLTVRVALFQDARSVVISSSGPITIQFAGRAPWRDQGPLTITPNDRGVQVAGRRHGENGSMLRLRGPGDLIVRVSGGTVPSEHVAPPRELVLTGLLEIRPREGSLLLVNHLDLEAYVQGVLPAEMNSSWHLEALKAQAVAARTYALHRRDAQEGQPYDVAASTEDQVYSGHGRDPRVEEATEATRGQILTYLDKPIFAAFSSTAAGPTEEAVNVWSEDLPYLKSVACPFDTDSPYFEWTSSFTLEALETALGREGYAIGPIAGLTPLSLSQAGRISKIRILHARGELILSGQEFRRLVGYRTVPSTQFEITGIGRHVTLAGRGSGHAVGLCQWGAKELAELGYSYKAILRYYFPGTELKRVDVVRTSAPAY